MHSLIRPVTGLLSVALAVFAVGCSKSNNPAGPGNKERPPGQPVAGKVTYQGTPVGYGFVLFFNTEYGVDPASGGLIPLSVARIEDDGRYSAPDVPEGHVLVCVATDPDLDPAQFSRPQIPAEEPPDGAKGIFEGPAPPPPMPGGPVPTPPGVAPIGLPKGGPPIPSMPAGAPRKHQFDEKQTKLLKEIHKKYGSVAKARGYQVRQGAQEFDIKLD